MINRNIVTAVGLQQLRKWFRKLVLRQVNWHHRFISIILVQMWHFKQIKHSLYTGKMCKCKMISLNVYLDQFMIEYTVIVFTGDWRWNLKTENFHLRRHVQHQFFSHRRLPQKRGPCLPVNCQVIVIPSRAQFIVDNTWLSSQHVSSYFCDCCYVFRQIVPQCSQAPWSTDGRWWTIWMPCGDLWQGV